jgi:deoxyribodipyrimidine photo-lyase
LILTGGMQTQYASGLVWFRRDLRTHDNTALNTALQLCDRVYCVFVLDTDILAPLPRQDRRVEFIRESLVELDHRLRTLSGQSHAGLIVLHGMATQEIPTLARTLNVQAVFAGRDYEPRAMARDSTVQQQLRISGIELHLRKDHVVFEEREVLTQTGKPYGVFTPYKKAWLARLALLPTQETAPTAPQRLAARPDTYRTPVPDLHSIGFTPTNLSSLRIPTGETGAQGLLADFVTRMDVYDQTRNFPSVKGPSYLSVHLRFGTVSIRQLVNQAYPRHLQGNEGASTWLGELVWRDFYVQILANYPHVATCSFKPEYDQIAWEKGPHAHALFEAWCSGQTGYPLVDAAMAQLNQTGYMHNRLRMVVGSFLVKHLGIDWRWGEAYFAQTLNDFDLSANNGGWQWVSSSGCDAQPYFRIFNPIAQSEKFDAEGKFIQRYLPRLAPLGPKAIHAPWLAKPLELSAAGLTLGQSYPLPVVEHAKARARTLLRYGVVKKPA